MRALPELEPGTMLGPYKVGAELGRGGIAVVYRAVHTSLSKVGEVAIKVAFRTNEHRDRRFIREFERLRVIAIPGVTRVYEAGTTDDLVWYTMDVIPGLPMNRRIALATSLRERIDIALSAGARLFDVLDGIHRLGFIHRDVKPSNILVDDDNTAHVLDFGLVRLQERGDTMTRAGRLVGTVAFMSPEQTTGLPLTPQTDIFSAGLVLYEGLVGPRPRPHRQEEWLGRMCLQRVEPLCIREPGIPRALSTAVDRMLALDPHARPTAAEAAEMLRTIRTRRAQSDWPAPPQFVGREAELEQLMKTFENQSQRLAIMLGPEGSGRRRLLEQIQRRALLYGTPRLTGECRPEQNGGAVLQVLQQLFRTHADPEWRRRIVGNDADPLLTMWPTLPVPAPPPSPDAPTMQQVAQAAAGTIHRAVDSAGLMVVFTHLERIDSLTARVIQLLVQDPPDRLGIFATCDDRWQSKRTKRLLSHLGEQETAISVQLPDLSSEEATELAQSLCRENSEDTLESCSPLNARESGLAHLANQRGELYAPLPHAALPLAIALGPVSEPVLKLLDIEPEPLRDDGLIRKHEKQGYVLSDPALAVSGASRIADRQTIENALADAMARAGIGSERWAKVATHMYRGNTPNRALAPAIRASVHAVNNGRYEEARNWLMAIDPLPRDPEDPTYKALRFELAWCRAKTSLATDLSRIREDLVDRVGRRASSDIERARVDLLRADLRARQGKMEEAVAACEAATSIHKQISEDARARFPLRAARILLDHGLPERARPLIQESKRLADSTERALVQIDLALLEGHPNTAAQMCRTAIAKATDESAEPLRARLRLRLGSALLNAGERAAATQAVHHSRDSLIRHSHRARLAEAHYLVAKLALGRGQPTAAAILVDPLITTARSFAMGRLQVLGCALKLRLAAAMNDKAAAREAISARSAKLRTGEEDWRLALLRWHRSQRDLDQAIEHTNAGPPRTYAGVWLAIENARVHLVRGDQNQAMDTLLPAIEMAQDRGLKELELLAKLVLGATSPDTSKEGEAAWDDLLHAARCSAWVELSLGALDLNARRLIALGETSTARQHFEVLLRRSDHLGHGFHKVVANEGLIAL